LPSLFTGRVYLVWAIGLTIFGLVLGWLTAKICTSAVGTAVSRETDLLQGDIRRRLAGVAHDLVIVPAELELTELEQFRADLRIATGQVVRY
jgi:hypothetical protein